MYVPVPSVDPIPRTRHGRSSRRTFIVVVGLLTQNRQIEDGQASSQLRRVQRVRVVRFLSCDIIIKSVEKTAHNAGSVACQSILKI